MEVKLPHLGEGADSGVVVNVLVKEGDTLQQGQTILELENEKAVAPIPAPAAGRVGRIHVKPGDTVNVGCLLLTLDAETSSPSTGASGQSSPASPATAADLAASAPSPAAAPAGFSPQEPPGGDPPPASPGVRKIAADLGLDLRRVRGSQPGGRVIMDDLRSYIQWLTTAAFARHAAATAATSAIPTASTAPAAAAPEPVDFARWGPIAKKPITPLRKVISRRMSESWQTVPRVTQFEEIDITDLMDQRKRHAKAYEAQGGNLTLTCFVLKALVESLKKHPQFAASFDAAAQEIVFKQYYHLGIAVDTEAGLLVPVIREADKKSLLDLSKELVALAERARARKIAAEEMQGGVFTVSNQGAIGGGHFTPIVNLPEAGILGLGRGALKPAVVGGAVVPRLLLPVALSYDHRIIDGASAARFVMDFSQGLAGFPETSVAL